MLLIEDEMSGPNYPPGGVIWATLKNMAPKIECGLPKYFVFDILYL